MPSYPSETRLDAAHPATDPVHDSEDDNDEDAMGIASSPRQPPPSGELKSIACELCRRRKSFCSKTTPKCDRCRQKNLRCEYKPAKKITVTEDFIRDLQNKVRLLEVKAKAYESALGLTKQPASRGQLEAFQAQKPDNEEIEATSLLMGQLNVNSAGSYQGAAAADHLLTSLGQLVSIEPEDDILDTSASATRTFYNADLLPSRRLMGTGYVDLPPLEVARENFKAQYEYIGTIFSFCSHNEFEGLLIHGYSQQSQMLELEFGLAFAKLLVLLAFGQLYSINKWVGRNGPPGFDLFTAAIQYLPDIHENGSILFVETLALIGYFMQNLNRRDAALLYVGLASRMAISLGLHEEVSSPHVDEPTKERRRRVWWSVYSLDCILSAKSGTPLSIASGDIGVHLPSRLLDEPEYCPAVVLRHYTMLSRILGDISRNIYRKARRPGAKLVVADVHCIMQQLDQWYKQLPPQLLFSAGRTISRESVSTMLHYYMCLNMTARPLFFHVFQRRLKSTTPGEKKGTRESKEKDWKEGLGATTVSVIEICIDAARKTVEMMSVAARVNLVATYGYMDSEHAFAAAIVLVMICVAFPASDKNTRYMNAALKLLRFMADRGNSHLADRLGLLERVRAMATGENSRAQGFPEAQRQQPDSPLMGRQAFSSTDRQVMMGIYGPWDFNISSPFIGPSVGTGSGHGASLTYGAGTGSDGSRYGFGSSPPQNWSAPTPLIPLSDPALGTVLDATAPSGWDSLAGDNDAGLWEDSFANPDLNMDMDADLTMLTESMGGIGGG